MKTSYASTVIRKVIFSGFQLLSFVFEILRGRGSLSPQIMKVDWSDSHHRRRFVIIGTLELLDDQILIKTGNHITGIADSPQRNFFCDLSSGMSPENTDYFKLVRALEYQVDYGKWFSDKVLLWRTFDPNSREVLPIVVRRKDGKFEVEDGAHRLALLSLRGAKKYRVGVSVWFLG